ncbi:MAG: helix-turn-helix domain-containing protein [Anaerolineales bacterium]
MATTSVTIALDRFTTFGDLLKYLRRRAGLTQRELSIAVGYSDTQISRLEQNERLPDLATLTARFLPALHIEDQPEVAERLLELAAAVRREDAPAAGLPPYKGLQYFEESDAELYFGREALTDQLLERLMERLETDERFLAIIGASGSGKSSLVRAGLTPALHWHLASSGWPVLILTPTAHPLEALATLLIQEVQLKLPARKVVDNLMGEKHYLEKSLTKLAQASGAAYSVLIVDQLEEIFTLCRSEAEQAAFVDSLITAAFEPGGKAMIVVALRADFYAHCARYNRLRQAISKHQEYIGPMTHEELRRAIEAPAQQGHWQLESGLVNLLLHDVGADIGQIPEPGALPLLSHALLSTWQRRRGRTMTLSGYTASGGVRGAIAETAEAVFYDQFDAEQREVARQIFLRLTELGGEASTADTRRRVTLDELVIKPGSQELVREVLLALADARLITTDQDSAEVAHEALIREWPTLRNWLEEDREGLRLHRRLTEAAQEWEVLTHDAAVLYRGTRLAQALDWAAEHPDDLNQLEQSFLSASQALIKQEEAEREAQRQRELAAAQRLAETERARAEEQTQASQRLRWRAVFLTIALIAVGVLAGAALIFWQRAAQANRLATSRELAAAANNNLQVDPERSVLLALHALQETDTLEARNALHQAVPELHLLLNLPAHEGGVPDVAYSPDGTRLASMGAYGEVKVWDANTGELLLTLNGETDEAGSSIAFSPDGNTLAATWFTKVVLWDLPSGKIKAVFSGQSVGTSIGYNLGVGQVGFSPDGKYLAVANLDGLPSVWELAKQSVVLTLGGGELPAKAIAYSPDGRLLATGGDEGIVTVWDAASGKSIYALSLGGIIHSVSFDPAGPYLAGASEDGSVKVWEMDTGGELLSLPRQAGLYDITFLVDGRFATAGQDGTTRVWDLASGQQQLTLAGGTSTVISVAGSSDGKHIASGAWDGSLRVWDAAPGRELMTIPGHAGIVWNVAYSPDGEQIASASVDGFVRVWEAETGRQVLELSREGTPTSGFTGVTFSQDGSQLAAGGQDGSISIWDRTDGKLVRELSGHSNYVTGLSFSFDGTQLASASWDGNVIVWDLIAGKPVVTFRGKTFPALITNVAFSPDGKTVFAAVADDKLVYQWEVSTGQEVRTLSGEDKEIYGLAVSPDGSLLAGGTQDGNIVLWSVASGEKLRTFSGHAGVVLRLVFNQDGSRLASAGFDRLAKVWDAATGQEVASLYGNLSNVFGVAFSPEGERLATGGADGTLRTYTLDVNQLIELASARLTRTLNQQECQKFLHIKNCPNAQP